MKKHLKSKTQLFNGFMLLLDTLIANAALIQEVITIKQFAVTMLVLKVLQTLGNFYLRSITTEPISAK